MQPTAETIRQTLYIPGKKPSSSAAAAAMGPKHRNGISHHHSHSTPPPTTYYTKTGNSYHSIVPPATAPRPRSYSVSSSGEMTTVLVGRKRQAFVVNRRLLCAASPFFRDQLQQRMHSSPSPSPSSYSSSPSSLSPSTYLPSPATSRSSSSLSSRSQQHVFYTYKPITLWLPGESTTMFGLFVEWLHSPSSFRSYLDDTAALAQQESDRSNATNAGGESPTQLLHWALIRLHLFASHLELLPLQDLAMDAIQDLYLRCDWDIAPSVIAYLYTRCETSHAVRLRRWAVAMVAFSLTVAWHLTHEQQQRRSEDSSQSYRVHQRTASSSSSSSTAPVCDPARLHSMLDALPEFADDYATHVRSMRAAGLDMRFKNPQLRIPDNTLRNDKRVFGFRECSFHSHRAAVGQSPCPHAASGLRAADTGSMLDLDPHDEKEEEEAVEFEDDEDDETGQWEREWAGDYLELDYELSDYSYVPTTSLRPPPPPPPTAPALTQSSVKTPIIRKPLPSQVPRSVPKPPPKLVTSRPLMSKFGGYVPKYQAADGEMLPTPI